MLAETMSLPPIHEYSRRLGVPGLALESSRVPFVAAAMSVLLTCRQSHLLTECFLTEISTRCCIPGVRETSPAHMAASKALPIALSHCILPSGRTLRPCRPCEVACTTSSPKLLHRTCSSHELLPGLQLARAANLATAHASCKLCNSLCELQVQQKCADVLLPKQSGESMQRQSTRIRGKGRWQYCGSTSSARFSAQADSGGKLASDGRALGCCSRYMATTPAT